MNKLTDQLQAILPKGMHIPEPIVLLYKWIEANNFYQDFNGQRTGYLFDPELTRITWTDTERENGTWIDFQAINSEGILGWFGGDAGEEVLNRLCLFAQAGAEGSTLALWLDDNNEIKIVLLGSGSGSTAMCIIAENAIEFLRLLAIGYDEICWLEDFSFPPNQPNSDFTVKPNLLFQEWLIDNFEVTIPETAASIVKNPAEMGDNDSNDRFCQWYNKHIS